MNGAIMKIKILNFTLPAMFVAIAGLAGCQEPIRGVYLASPDAMAKVCRVAFIQLAQEPHDPPVSRSMTWALFREVQKRKIFHLDVVMQSDPMLRELPLDRTQQFTTEELAEFQKALGCDAVLVGKVTKFQTYPAMQVGLYLRMIDLRSGVLLWAVEQVWDARDKDVEDRVKGFYDRRLRDEYGDPIYWELALRSQQAFEKFVSCEVAESLPMAGESPSTFANIRNGLNYLYRKTLK